MRLSVENNCCETCGAKLMGRWERLTPGLVRALIKFKREICARGRNDINPNRECKSMTHTELANFQKLRFHALVAKVKVDGAHVSGHWLLTGRGNQFLHGERIPLKVFIFRNKIEERSEETVDIREVLRSSELPVFDEKSDYLARYERVSDRNSADAELF